MRPLISLLKIIVLSASGVRDLIAENPRVLAGALLIAGTVLWTLESSFSFNPFSLLIHAVVLLVYVAFIYVPAAVIVCNLFAGDGLSFQISRQEYESNFVSLASLLGVVLLAAAAIGSFNPAIGFVALAAGYLIYVPFALKETNSLTWAAGAGAAAALIVTFPLAAVGMKFLFALPLFLLIWLLWIGSTRLGAALRDQRRRGRFEEQLRLDLINPHDSDACYQLGWLYLKKRRFADAEKFLRKAVELQPLEADYHYGLARALIEQERWMDAFEPLEKVYQIEPHYQMGDVLRDLGLVYLQLDYPDQAEQFLCTFLEERVSDAQGKYWLAQVLVKKGQLDEARLWLRRLAGRAETPGGFHKMETRYWKRKGRELARKIGE
ncbi:MAG TPA: tetratricopeptide repeat protein [Acidobacteriota bacterium]|jgi:tetratricopeptide (TPR) repeat protein|nr:tetratricopeptide repeat protein [Acidobacteriota bacterium]